MVRNEGRWSAIALCACVACGGQTERGRAETDGAPADASVHASGGSGHGGSGSGGRGAVGDGGAAGLHLGMGSGGAAGNVGTGGQSRDGGTCTPYERPVPCDTTFYECITDFRAVKSRFPTCGAGPSGMPFAVRCAEYDALGWFGIDSGMYYFFDQLDGHFVGLSGTGFDSGVCQSVVPSFQPPKCDEVPACPFEDAGAVGRILKCGLSEPGDAGSAPAFCPMPASPRPVLGAKPGSGNEPDTVTVKFVEGSHVRMNGSGVKIEALALLDEDPELLRCAHLSVPDATCFVASLQESLFTGHPNVVITRAFLATEPELDQARAEARAKSGVYQDDMNLFYVVRAPAEEIAAIYALFAGSPIVDTVYYNPKGSLP